MQNHWQDEDRIIINIERKNKFPRPDYRLLYSLHSQPGPDLLHAGYFLRSREKVGRPAGGAGQPGVEVQLPADSSQQRLVDLFLPLGGAVGSELLRHPQ